MIQKTRLRVLVILGNKSVMVDRNNRMVIQARDSMVEVTQQASKKSDLINEATSIIDEILKGAEYVLQVVVNSYLVLWKIQLDGPEES